jgi:hypothetical protein
MPVFQVHITNNDYESGTDVERDTRDEVRNDAILSAIQIGADEISTGSPFFGAEVRIESGGEVLERMVVAVGISQLR